MSQPIDLVERDRHRAPSRPGRPGTISPTNSFDPAFKPPPHPSHPSDPLSSPKSLSSSPSASPNDKSSIDMCPFFHSSTSSNSSSSSSSPSESPSPIIPPIDHCSGNTVEEVGERLRSLLETKKEEIRDSSLEILPLPPLLSLLPPSSSSSPFSPLYNSSIVEYTDSTLPSITPLSQSLHSALHQFRLITTLYSILPYSESFNFSQLRLEGLNYEDLGREREWYVVAFRSKRRKGFGEQERKRLYEADREAHEEAVRCGGLLCYWFGSPSTSTTSSSSSINNLSTNPTTLEEEKSSEEEVQVGEDHPSEGRNLATCIWESRQSAIEAMRGEKHRQAAKLASISYESYTLERYILRKDRGSNRVRITDWIGKDVVGKEY